MEYAQKIGPEMTSRAVRMVLELRDDYPSVTATAGAVGTPMGQTFAARYPAAWACTSVRKHSSGVVTE
jgi:hypothetical protein